MKWHFFIALCSREDLMKCGIGSVLSFIQEGPDRLLSLSTYKVSVTAIEAKYDIVDGKSVGKHNTIFRFLRISRRLNPPTANIIPSWDLSVVLQTCREIRLSLYSQLSLVPFL